MDPTYTCARVKDAAVVMWSYFGTKSEFHISIHSYGGKDTCMSPSIVNRPSPTTATTVYMYGAIRITPTQM